MTYTLVNKVEKTKKTGYSYSASNPKPFLKWAGGKTQLMKEIEKYIPFDGKTIKKYAEPFVGGGAVLFHILGTHEIEQVYISDTNFQLINTYCVIRDNVEALISDLAQMQEEFIPLVIERRKEYYYEKRELFNRCLRTDDLKQNVQLASLMIFLNRTCFNGLYRVNKKGLFNVPIGAYNNPKICDEGNLHAVSEKLKNVEIICGDYKKSAEFIDERTFAYFDPPYRPLSETASFTAYTEQQFDDEKQIELSRFVSDMAGRGAKIVVSNSDPKNVNEQDDFFENIYSGFSLERVNASRMINSNSKARGKISELLISNCSSD